MNVAVATLQYQEPGKLPSVVLAVAVHVLLAVFLFFGVRWQNKEPEAVMVELWSSPPAPVVEKIVAEPAPPKPEPVPEIKPAPKVEKVIEAPLEGLVLETYGAGNAPGRDAAFLGALERATKRGVVVVNCSQCHGGRVRQGLYQTSSALARVGVISGHDMTPEAALTKLYCLLASGLDVRTVRAQMEQDLAGELTPLRR